MASDDIQGTITDTSGQAISGATVALWLQDSPNQVTTTTTDASGNYIFEDHPDGDGTSKNWHLAARDPNDSSRQFRSLHTVSASLPAPTTIPDSVVSLYEYEDDSDTTTAIDSQGSNNATINGATYTTTANVGSLALSHDGSDDNTQSQNSVDLSALGDTAGLSIAAYLYFPSPLDTSDLGWCVSYGIDSNNEISIYNNSGDFTSIVQESSGSNSIITGPSISADTWYHVYAELQADGTHDFYVDNVSQGSNASTNDPSGYGSMDLLTSQFAGGGREENVIVDDFAACSDPLTDSERQTLIDRAN